MKFWNKSKEYRKTWAHIVVQHKDTRLPVAQTKRELQHTPGSRFFMRVRRTNDYQPHIESHWHFENPADAAYFTLKFL